MKIVWGLNYCKDNFEFLWGCLLKLYSVINWNIYGVIRWIISYDCNLKLISAIYSYNIAILNKNFAGYKLMGLIELFPGFMLVIFRGYMLNFWGYQLNLLGLSIDIFSRIISWGYWVITCNFWSYRLNCLDGISWNFDGVVNWNFLGLPVELFRRIISWDYWVIIQNMRWIFSSLMRSSEIFWHKDLNYSIL